MKIIKFYNETFNQKMEVVLYKDNQKDCEKADSYLISKGLDKSVVYDNIKTALAFCVNFSDSIVVVFDIKTLKEKGSIETIKTIQHECGHFREFTLNNISEYIQKTDSEVYLRISDWAFKKIVSIKYFNKLLK